MKNEIKYIKTVILGAGLAGLSTAYHGEGVIYEREKEIGGTCRSLRSDAFIFDLGIHVLHTQNRYVLDLLARNKNLKLKEKKRSAWIYSYGVLTKYPFQANTYGLPKHVIRECLDGFKKALGGTKKNYSNYEEWIYATFGKGIADNFYLPYSEKFWTVGAKDLTTDWLGARVPRPRLEQVIKGASSLQEEEFGPNAIFRYPQYGGIQKLTESLLNKNIKIMLDKEAIKINLSKKTISFSDKTSVSYDNLILTIPLPELLKIIERVPQEVKQAVGGLRYNSILCVNLGIKRENLTPFHWIYFPEKEYIPFRVSFPNNFSKFVVPKYWSSIQTEISYSKYKPIIHKDIVEKVIQDLIKAKIIKSKDKIKLINTRDIKYGYVIYDHNRISNLKVINKFLNGYNIYNAGRYGRWEYLWMDEAILSGRIVAGKIKSAAR